MQKELSPGSADHNEPDDEGEESRFFFRKHNIKNHTRFVL